MDQSNASSNPSSPRPTLTLKVAARKFLRESKSSPTLQVRQNSKSKPGAQWSEEYRERMQADMARAQEDLSSKTVEASVGGGRGHLSAARGLAVGRAVLRTATDQPAGARCQTRGPQAVGLPHVAERAG